MKLISWNVNGIRAVEKKGFVNIVKSLNCDILALQETKAQKEQLSDELLNINLYKSFWHSAEKKGYSSVALYCKKDPMNVVYGLGKDIFDKEGRVIIAEYEDFFLFNCYFPNVQPTLLRINYRLAFSDYLLKVISEKYTHKTVIICGDFNVAHQEIDLARPKENVGNPGFTDEERQWFSKFLSKGFIDIFRYFYPDLKDQYTWWSYRTNARARNIGWRIDYFCIDENSKHRLKKAEILPTIMGSDHCPVLLQI